MADEAQRLSDTQVWLLKAQRDLAAASQLSAQHKPLLDVVVYHCHQASEKALKGYLFWHGIPFRRTHNLTELLAQCGDIDVSLSTLEEAAILLSPFATELRYPGDRLEPPMAEALQTLEFSAAFVGEVLKRLPQAVASV